MEHTSEQWLETASCLLQPPFGKLWTWTSPPCSLIFLRISLVFFQTSTALAPTCQWLSCTGRLKPDILLQQQYHKTLFPQPDAYFPANIACGWSPFSQGLAAGSWFHLIFHQDPGSGAAKLFLVAAKPDLSLYQCIGLDFALAFEPHDIHSSPFFSLSGFLWIQTLPSVLNNTLNFMFVCRHYAFF